MEAFDKASKPVPPDFHEPDAPALGEIKRSEDHVFNERIEKLLEYAEHMRLNAMKEHRNRGFLAMSVGLTAICLGAAGFGWFLLVEAQIVKALGAIILGIVVAAGINIWSGQSTENYKRDYKTKFLPRLGKVLGNLQYYPNRGISAGVLPKTGVIPPHDTYTAEDCFMGKYKGVKVLFSEARLRRNEDPRHPVFNGVFVLLETPNEFLEGHTILTADRDMVKSWRASRWNKLQDVVLSKDVPGWDRFSAYSSQPEAAAKMIDARMLKELTEASDIFEKSPISVVFFNRKYVFMMIPYEGDMFEASHIHIPIATKRTALQCKREIDKIMEIIDIFEMFQAHTH